MKLLFATMLVAFIGWGCNSSQEVVGGQTEEIASENFYMRIERTPCFGACPTDILVIQNRELTYEGIRHVDRQGKYTATLTEAQFDALRQKFDALNFFEFEDKYDAGVSDLPSTIIEVNINDSTKQVINRYMGPRELKSFEIWVFSYVDKLSWSPVEDQDQ
jgi:hypothetical protein